MLALVARRLVGLVATLVLASLVVFLVLEVLSGDPARLMLGINASDEAVEALRQRLGLNDPLTVQYARWIAGLPLLEFGRSLTYGTDVGTLIALSARVSLPLALASLALTVLIAVPVGAFAARRRGRAADTAVMGMTQLGIAVPNFWLAILLVYVFAVGLRWVPAGGFPGWDDPWQAARTLILPTVALAVPQAAILARVVRSAIVETLGTDFIRTARAKGASEARTLRHHAVRNALVPVLTIVGLQFAFLLSGVVIIEQVFSLPGLGRLAFEAIRQDDLPVVRGVVMALVATVILTNFVVDLAYALVDPRLRVPR